MKHDMYENNHETMTFFRRSIFSFYVYCMPTWEKPQNIITTW